VAVIDGSTSKSDRRYSRSSSNGSYAMQLIAKAVRKAPKDLTVTQMCRHLTRAVANCYTSPFTVLRYGRRQTEYLAQHPEDRLCASVVIYSRLRREVWMIGDCQCLIGGELFENPKPYEQPLAEQRASEARRLLDAGTTVQQLRTDDEARRSIIPDMIECMKGQNVTYAVVDGFPIPQDKVRVLTLDFQPWEIVLATDGYSYLCPTLQESEEKLQWQREHDPLNIGDFKATKAFSEGNNSFDDRTYIRFKV